MMIRKDGIVAGEINHVLHLFWEETCESEGFVHPMVKEEDESGAAPSGIRIRIKPDSRLEPDLADQGLSGDAYTVAKALQDYGAYIGDSAGNGGTASKVEQDFEVPGGHYWDFSTLNRDSFANKLDWDDFEFVKAGYDGTWQPNPPVNNNPMCAYTPGAP